MGAAGIWSVEIKGIKALKATMKALGDFEAPYLQGALAEAGELLAQEIGARAPGSMASSVDFVSVKGAGAALRALVKISHPGAKAMEFGRTQYYRGFKKRKQKATGQAFKASPGQPMRPFVGIIKGDAAIGAVAPKVTELIAAAIEQEWAKLASLPD